MENLLKKRRLGMERRRGIRDLAGESFPGEKEEHGGEVRASNGGSLSSTSAGSIPGMPPGLSLFYLSLSLTSTLSNQTIASILIPFPGS
jgi:hypothetical protein